jgi:hypothetical protein
MGLPMLRESGNGSEGALNVSKMGKGIYILWINYEDGTRFIGRILIE